MPTHPFGQTKDKADHNVCNVDLISRRFAEVVPLVVRTEKIARLRVDVDHLAVAPDAGVFFVEGAGAVDLVAGGRERFGDGHGEELLYIDAVGKVLHVEARGVGGLLHVEAVVEDADDVVRDCGDNG